MKKVCVLGLGYIGLPTAALIANSGVKVIGVDLKKSIVDNINNGVIDFQEQNLRQIIEKVVSKKLLVANSKPINADVYLIAVPTPIIQKNPLPEADLQYVIKAALEISKVIKEKELVIIESTCPVGTTKKISRIISQNSGLREDQFEIAYCPERVMPGNTFFELVNNNRVIGGMTKKASKKCIILYRSFCKGDLEITNHKTAELVKLSENSFRDVNIAFSNELSILCERFNIDIYEVIKLVNKHPRVNILEPGCGVGGHCIPLDPWFIASSAPDISNLIQTARLVNTNKARWVESKILSFAKKIEIIIKRKPIIGCMGLSYKPNVDDLRESPALEITLNLINKGFKIMACEPNIKNHPLIKIFLEEDIIEKVDFLVFLVNHKSFKKINLRNIEYMDFCGINNLIS